jgi:hypothetical protein
MEIKDQWKSIPWRNMPSNKTFPIIRREAQLFDAAHTSFGGVREAPVWEIHEPALKER